MLIISLLLLFCLWLLCSICTFFFQSLRIYSFMILLSLSIRHVIHFTLYCTYIRFVWTAIQYSAHEHAHNHRDYWIFILLNDFSFVIILYVVCQILAHISDIPAKRGRGRKMRNPQRTNSNATKEWYAWHIHTCDEKWMRNIYHICIYMFGVSDYNAQRNGSTTMCTSDIDSPLISSMLSAWVRRKNQNKKNKLLDWSIIKGITILCWGPPTKLCYCATAFTTQ